MYVFVYMYKYIDIYVCIYVYMYVYIYPKPQTPNHQPDVCPTLAPLPTRLLPLKGFSPFEMVLTRNPEPSTPNLKILNPRPFPPLKGFPPFEMV